MEQAHCHVPADLEHLTLEPREPSFPGDFSHNTGTMKGMRNMDKSFLALSLVIPTIIGAYQAWRTRKQLTLEEYLLAGHNMGYLPVGLSLMSSFLSGLTMLGAPAEVYIHNTEYFWVGVGFLIVSSASAHIYVPVFYKLKVNSVYEYLEMRFSRGVRTVGSSLFLIQMILYMSFVLYAPSVAFSAVTGMNMWGAIVGIGIICTLYVTIGGIRTVLWTDSFQMILMLVTTLVMLLQAASTVGTDTMIKSAVRTKRLVFFDLRVDPTLRHSTWSLFFGGGFSFLSLYAVNQAQIHRCLTCRTLRDAKIALWMSLPGHMIFLVMSIGIGLYMSAFYENCDPMQTKLVGSRDELTPFFMQDILGHVPGLSGFYMAGVFSATLSTVSSGLNSISMVVLEDYIRVYLRARIVEKRERLYTQILCVIFGFICLEMTFLVERMGGVLQAGMTFYGILAGPVLGLFSLGMFFPWANEKGAFAGVFSAIAITFLNSLLPKAPDLKIPTKCVANCNATAFKTISRLALLRPYTTMAPGDQTNGVRWYGISYMWFSCLACFSCIIIGLLVSRITGSKNPLEVDPRLIVPLLDEVFPFYYLPESKRAYFRFGIDHKDKFNIVIPRRRSSVTVTSNREKRTSESIIQSLIEHKKSKTPSQSASGVASTVYSFRNIYLRYPAGTEV